MNERKWMIVSDIIFIAGMIYMSYAADFVISKVIYGICAVVVFVLELLMNYSKESVQFQSIRTSKRYIYLIVFGVVVTMISSWYLEGQNTRNEHYRMLSEEEILEIYEEAYPEHDEITGIYYSSIYGADYEILTSGENQWSITFIDHEKITGNYEGEGTLNLYNGIVEDYNNWDSEEYGIYMINQVDQELYKYIFTGEIVDEETYKYNFKEYDLGSIDAIQTDEFYTNLFYTNFTRYQKIIDIYVADESDTVQAVVLFSNHYDSNGCVAYFTDFNAPDWFSNGIDMTICDETSLTLNDDHAIECIFEKEDGGKQKLIIALDGTYVDWEDLEEK